MNYKFLLLVIEILVCGVAAILYNAVTFYALSSNRLRQTKLGQRFFPALQAAAGSFTEWLSGLRVGAALGGVREFLIFVLVLTFLLMIAVTVITDALSQAGFLFVPLLRPMLMKILTWILIASMMGYASLKWTLDHKEMAKSFFTYYAFVILLIFALMILFVLYVAVTDHNADASQLMKLLLAVLAVTASLCLAAVLLYVILWIVLGVPAGVGGTFILFSSKAGYFLKKYCSEDNLTYLAFMTLVVQWLFRYILIPLSVASILFNGSPWR